MKKTTVYDVAKHANVSVSSVSRYLNRTTYIAKPKIAAIERAMAELDFQPKVTKSSAASRRSMQLGVITPTFDSPFIGAIMGGLDMEISHSSYRLEIEVSKWTSTREQKILKQMIAQGVDGLILIVPSLDVQQIKSLVGDTPVIFVGRNGEGMFESLMVDNQLGGYIATNHLLQLGHRNIVHVQGYGDRIDAKQRLLGYQHSLEAAGIAFRPELVIEGAYKSQQAYDSTLQLIKRKQSFSAVFAANDDSAYGVIQALYQQGIRVPEQVSVIGFDDLPVSRFFIPRLTTIKQPLESLGQISIKSILDMISNNPTRYTIPPATLIKRDSTAIVSQGR